MGRTVWKDQGTFGCGKGMAGRGNNTCRDRSGQIIYENQEPNVGPLMGKFPAVEFRYQRFHRWGAIWRQGIFWKPLKSHQMGNNPLFNIMEG